MNIGGKNIKMTSDNYKVCIDGLVNSKEKNTHTINRNRENRYVFHRTEVSQHYIFEYAFKNNITVTIEYIDDTPFLVMKFLHSLYTLEDG